MSRTLTLFRLPSALVGSIELRERFYGEGYTGSLQLEPALSWMDRQALQHTAEAAMASAVELHNSNEALRRLNLGQDLVVQGLTSLENALGLRLDIQTRVLSAQTEYLAHIDQALRTPAKTKAAERIADTGELLRRGRWDRALVLAREAIEADPNNPAGFRAAGWALLGLKDASEAKDCFLECAQAADGDEQAQALRQAARLTLALSDARQALALLEDLGELSQLELAAVDYDRTVYLAELGRLDDAAKALQRAMIGDDRFATLAFHDDLLARHHDLVSGARIFFDALLAKLDELRQRLDQLFSDSREALSERDQMLAELPSQSHAAWESAIPSRVDTLRDLANSTTARYAGRIQPAITELETEILPAATAARDEAVALLSATKDLTTRRHALQSMIDQSARTLAQEQHAFVRGTKHHVITLAPGYLVHPAIVHRQRKAIRPAKTWLVTLNANQDAVVIEQTSHLQ